MKPRVSVVIPAYNEGAAIEDVLGRLVEAIAMPSEIVVVVDAPDDSTVPYVEKYATKDPNIRVLINDVEANAWGVSALRPEEIVSLNKINATDDGNRAVIAAGTGLGEAGMYWDGTRHHIFACEGGHADFAPRNELEIDLFRYLGLRFGHVSWERIVSGPGLLNVFNFLRDTGRGSEPKWLHDKMLSTDPAAAISSAAIEGQCGLCEQALDLFVSVYAAEAGNLALKIMATGGVYIGGGIAPKILPKLAGPLFMQAFIGKGRMQPLLESMPVHVIINDNIALLGAARRAAQEGA